METKVKPKDMAQRPAQAQPQTAPMSEKDVHDMLFAISRVAGAMEAALRDRDPPLSLSQWTLLEAIAREERALRPSLLARRIGFSRQLVNSATRKLIAHQYVTSEQGGEDKKAVTLQITDTGRQALAEIARLFIAISSTLSQEQARRRQAMALKGINELAATVAANTRPAPGAAKPQTEETA